MEEVQWISIDKKQNGRKYSKNDKSSTLPQLWIQIFYLLGRDKLDIVFMKLIVTLY